MGTRSSGPERADKLLCKVTRELLAMRGFVFEGSDSDLIESDNPRSVEAVQAAQRILRITNPRLANMSAAA